MRSLVARLGSLLSEEISPTRQKCLITRNNCKKYINYYVVLFVFLPLKANLCPIREIDYCASWFTPNDRGLSSAYQTDRHWHCKALGSSVQLQLFGSFCSSKNGKSINLKLWNSLIQHQRGSVDAEREMSFHLPCFAQPEEKFRVPSWCRGLNKQRIWLSTAVAMEAAALDGG